MHLKLSLFGNGYLKEGENPVIFNGSMKQGREQYDQPVWVNPLHI